MLDVLIKFIFTAESLSHDSSDVITDAAALHCVLVHLRALLGLLRSVARARPGEELRQLVLEHGHGLVEVLEQPHHREVVLHVVLGDLQRRPAAQLGALGVVAWTTVVLGRAHKNI